MQHNKPNMLTYRFAQIVSWLVSKLIFRCKIVRNEIKNKKGPFVVIANHQASLDFVNLINARRSPVTFVISRSFYSTLPLRRQMDSIGVIPKQQFQTTLRDMRAMKRVIDEGRVLVIYPAGLMCEDGRSTPIPTATYQFLRWLRADVYVARTTGSYFVMPKWTSGFRPGRTYMDIYRLFTAEELAAADVDTVRERTDAALHFDAYREQETARVRYQKADVIRGLEQVLYQCPHCGREFCMQVKDRAVIYCTACGFAHRADKYGFLHNCGEVGEEIRYVSDWSRYIYDTLSAQVASGEHTELQAQTRYQMINPKTKKFADVGQGQITLSEEGFVLGGQVRGEEIELRVPTGSFASLPFKPGQYLEIQNGDDIYRCRLSDGRLAMKLINLVKIYYERAQKV